jgi:hypothetical protein
MTISASPLSTTTILFLSYLAYRITQSFIVRRRFDAFSKQHGCEEPLNVTGPLPFRAWAFVWRLMWVSPNRITSAIIITIHLTLTTIYRRAKSTGEDPLDDIICADFKYSHTLKKTVRGLYLYPDLIRNCVTICKIPSIARWTRIAI